MDMNIEIPPRYNFIVFSNNIFTCDTNGNLHFKEVTNPDLKSIYASYGYESVKNKRWDSYYIYLGQSLKNDECFLILELEIEEENELEPKNAAFFVVYKDKNIRYKIKNFDESNNVLTPDQCQKLFAKMMDIYQQRIVSGW